MANLNFGLMRSFCTLFLAIFANTSICFGQGNDSFLPLYEEGKVWEYSQYGGNNPADYIFQMKFGEVVNIGEQEYRKFYVSQIEEIDKVYSWETGKYTYSVGRTLHFDDKTQFYLIREEGCRSYFLGINGVGLLIPDDLESTEESNPKVAECLLYDFEAPLGAIVAAGIEIKGKVGESEEIDCHGTLRTAQYINWVSNYRLSSGMDLSDIPDATALSHNAEYIEGIGSITNGNVGCPLGIANTGYGFHDEVAGYRSHLHRVYNEITGETYYGSEVPYMEYFMTGPNSVHEIEDSLNIDFDGRFLYLPGDHKARNIEIYSLTGKRMLSASNATQIDLGSLPKGAYVVNLKSDNGTHVMKIVL